LLQHRSSLSSARRRDYCEDISDFSSDDRNSLADKAFAGLTVTKTGTLVANDYFVDTVTQAVEAAILYNSTAGTLSYDSDGKGGAAADVIAIMGKSITGFNFNDILLA
jgi:hypothetical protein